MEAPPRSWLPASRRWQPAIIVIYGAIAGRAQRWRAKNSRRDVPAAGGLAGRAGGRGCAVGRVPADIPVMGWLEVAASLPRRGEDIPAVQVARSTAGASGRRGDGDMPSGARCRRPCVAPFSVASGLCRPREPCVMPVLPKWPRDCGPLDGPVMPGPPTSSSVGGGSPGIQGGGKALISPHAHLPQVGQDRAPSAPSALPSAQQLVPRAVRCRLRGNGEDTAAMGTRAEPRGGWAALCQPWRWHMAAEQVAIRLKRINLYFPHFRGAGGAAVAQCPPPMSRCAPTAPVSAPLQPALNPN